jgi:glyceraldehyde-3-phosphate dehydrogenase (NADP+)
VQEFALDIAGEPVTTSRRVEIRNPHSGEVVGAVSFAGPAELERAVRAVVAAFEPMRRLAGHQRASLLAGVAERLRARREEFARSITAENGKPIKDSRGEVDRATATFAFAAEEAKRIPGEALPLDWLPGSEGRWGIVRRFPVGPVLAFTPFNFPLNLCAHKVAPALAAGCSILLKPAPGTPLTALRLGAVVREAGAPAGACTVAPCDNELAPGLVEDERFAAFSFTGSGRVGWALKGRAGRKRVTLELGGNAALIVHRDADLEAAVRRTLVGGFSYSGQTCISVQRVYAHRAVFDAYLEKLVAGVRALKVGDPFDETVSVSSLIRPGEAERVVAWIEEARGGGARVLVGGTRQGSVVAPTVLTGTRPEMKVVCEEVFGPLVVVEPYEELDAALAAVNAGRYGLQAGIYTHDLRAAWRAFETLEVGAVMVNEVPTYRADHMPYGGVKESGLGREGVRYAIEELTEPRLLVLNPGAETGA